ncbi:Frag1/DRAM/Sfk1 [Pilobolus umbonatus]|nr:Frag1/DRAM/Sfk1 [Pilobolus umbonatus]
MNTLHVNYLHTVAAYSAFLLALLVGCYTHYDTIVENEYYGYPQEWFPSVSATIGDRYPARSIFQILIALTSGPRFILVILWYFYTTQVTHSSTRVFGKWLLGIGLARTLTCAGWAYVTSTDHGDLHNSAMVVYLLLTIPWQLGVLHTSTNTPALKNRRRCTGALFCTLIPMIYFYIQHKMYQVAGAYSIYSVFEWTLILYDVGFDAMTVTDYRRLEIRVDEKNCVNREQDEEMV